MKNNKQLVSPNLSKSKFYGLTDLVDNNETQQNTSGEPNDSILNGLCDDDVLDNEQMPSDEEDGDDNPEMLAAMEAR